METNISTEAVHSKMQLVLADTHTKFNTIFRVVWYFFSSCLSVEFTVICLHILPKVVQ